MINKTRKIERAILIFLAIAMVFCITNSIKEAVLCSREREAYEILNHALTLKIKGDTSYKEFCTDGGFLEVEKNWPSRAKSFYVAIVDQSMGIYEVRVFFDTGEVFYLSFTKFGHSKNKLYSFLKIEWPDKTKSETHWNTDPSTWYKEELSGELKRENRGK